MTAPQHAAPGQMFSRHSEFYKNSAYSAFDQEHRGGGSFGMSMIEVEQDPIDMIDPPIPEFVFIGVRTPAREVSLDYGDGLNHCLNVPADSFVVVPARIESRHRVIDSHSLTMATLPIEQVDHVLDEAGLTQDAFAAFYAQLTPAPTAVRLLDVMWRVTERSDPFANLHLDGLTLQFLATVAGHGALSPLAPERPEDDRIARTIDYIEAHLGEALTVGELSAIACLSPGHFSRTFKATIGEPVWTYVQRRRCERAREMLTVTRDPIAQIAHACGFANQSHLTTHFGNIFGHTPAAYRKGLA